MLNWIISVPCGELSARFRNLNELISLCCAAISWSSLVTIRVFLFVRSCAAG